MRRATQTSCRVFRTVTSCGGDVQGLCGSGSGRRSAGGRFFAGGGDSLVRDAGRTSQRSPTGNHQSGSHHVRSRSGFAYRGWSFPVLDCFGRFAGSLTSQKVTQCVQSPRDARISSAMSVKIPSTPQLASSRARVGSLTVHTFICSPASWRRFVISMVRPESSG